MEIVENKKYYHIHRGHLLEIGKTVFIGKEKNGFNGYFDKFGHNYKSPITGEMVNSYFLSDKMTEFTMTNLKNPYLEKHFSYDRDEAIRHLTNTLSHYIKFSREQLFEEVRQEFFPNYPSRIKCLWIIPDDQTAVDYWWNALGQKGKIFEINVSGKVHQASQQYLNLSTNSFDFIREQAFKYWTAKTGINKVEDECLFEGFVNVVAEKTILDFK
ncbi:DUF2441 domain-containing protein [Hyunsoonleella sp. SJ7]|uniref:DUF2441 domain-containing protein n=1 Tax=Hyunsoonleella aquatilis TaxID=2762758 RepID=A0A923KH74_9FLAO|nr:DUF2441 domain-containing protein [Hyunsoonleella aquatilis]MBC3759861.1 DUF2441 domain-containing protein [Hyunsoonleella aquatilis]